MTVVRQCCTPLLPIGHYRENKRNDYDYPWVELSSIWQVTFAVPVTYIALASESFAALVPSTCNGPLIQAKDAGRNNDY